MQDHRIAALEKQMANKELQWEQEKEKILKALKSERVNRRTAEAEKKALKKELQQVTSTQKHGPSPAEEAQYQLNLQTTTTKLQERTQKVQDVVTENTDLKKYIGTLKLEFEEEKWKIIGALNKERTKRCEAQATIRDMEKKLQDETSSLKQEELDKQEEFQVNQHKWSTLSCQAENAEKAVKALEASNTFLNLKLDQVTLEQRILITKTTSERKTLEEKNIETEARLKNKETEILQMEVKYKALEETNAFLNVKLDQVALEQRALITKTTSERKTLEEKNIETEARLKNKETEIIQMEVDYQALKETNAFLNVKLDQVALEQRILITKTTSERKTLEEKFIETEVRLKNKETEITRMDVEYKIKLAAVEVQMTGQLAKKDSKVLELEERIKVLIEQTVDLHVSSLHFEELSKLTDKQKAQIKKEAEKEKKDEEKRLAKQKKKEEKIEKEYRKTQKKEEAAKLKNDIEELKRLAKERKLRQKRGE